MKRKIVIVLTLLFIILVTGCSTNKSSQTVDNYTGYVTLKKDSPVLIDRANWPGSPELFLNYNGLKQTQYVVQYGDSLFKLARTYQTTINKIKEQNNLVSDEILVGQKLLITSTQLNYSYQNKDWIPLELKKGTTIMMKTTTDDEYYLLIQEANNQSGYLAIKYLIYR